ncbi:hypothetical protein TNCV_1110171 [Trichonephila clavipes]|nr:hypothetical protein TNCV_1110171 [Trichonephila clavipes]
MGYSKTQWAPRHLRNRQKDCRMRMCLEHLIQNQKDGRPFFELLVILDESLLRRFLIVKKKESVIQTFVVTQANKANCLLWLKNHIDSVL